MKKELYYCLTAIFILQLMTLTTLRVKVVSKIIVLFLFQIVAFLLAKNIQHGSALAEVHTIRLMFAISQVGISMSPTSNGKLYTGDK